MRVLYVFESANVGGAYKALLAMLKEMRKLGVDIIVMTGPLGPLNDELNKEGYKNVAVGHETAILPIHFHGILKPLHYIKSCLLYYVSELRAVRKASRLIDFKEIDLIHTNSARSTIGCRLSKKYGIPHITHLREFGDRDFDCIKRTPFYERILNQGTTKFVSISESVKNYWNDVKKIDGNKNSVIYDGVFYKDISESLDAEKKQAQIRMIIAGGVYPTKGQHLAVEAMGLLPGDVMQNISLDIVGWGSKKYITQIKQYAQERGYEDKIHFLGSINDVHERTGMYQIGLMCSRSEGFGLVTAEYMHGKLGIIASNSGASPELITDGKEGLLFECGDVKGLSNCILKFYYDRDLLVKLSNEAQNKARRLFTSETNAKSLFELYNQLMNPL